MGWPSKNPDDYLEPSRPPPPPRWLARRHGQPDPDPTDYWLSLCAGVAGFVTGGVLGELIGGNAMLAALTIAFGAQGSTQQWWRWRQKRRRPSDAA